MTTTTYQRKNFCISSSSWRGNWGRGGLGLWNL